MKNFTKIYEKFNENSWKTLLKLIEKFYEYFWKIKKN